jgi:hypothetical protein
MKLRMLGLLLALAVPLTTSASLPANGLQQESESRPIVGREFRELVALVGTPQQESDSPEIVGAVIQGKKLIVRGENFSTGAKVFIDGQKQKTKASEDDPDRILIVKKGAREIERNQLVALVVRNSNDQTSRPFGFFNGRTITAADNGKTLTFEVGEQVAIILGGGLTWSFQTPDPNVLRAVPTLVRILDVQGLFEAAAKGEVEIKARGAAECLSPPCEKRPEVEVSVRVKVD